MLLELELLEISPNYVTLVSRITQLSPLQPNHQREERYFTLHITCLINLVMTQIFSKKSELESTFAETINPKRSNIVSVIDRYPSMDVTSTLLEWAGQIRYKKNIFLRGIS